MGYKCRNKKYLFKNDMLKIFEETIELPSGKEVTWNFLDGRDTVGVIGVDDRDNFIFVKQYRPALRQYTTEIPGGVIEDMEDPVEAGIREFSEETGYRPSKMIPLGSFFSSPGFSTAKVYLFLGRDLVEVGQDLDEDEFLEVVKIPAKEVDVRFLEDGKTLLAYSLYLGIKNTL